MNNSKSDDRHSSIQFEDDYYKHLCSELGGARTLDELQNLILTWVQQLGFIDFLFVRLERCWEVGSKQGLLSSLPAMWMQRYQDNKMSEIDLVLNYAKNNVEPIFSSQIYGYIDDAPFDIPLTRNNRQVFQLYKRFGYAEHFVVPAPAINDHGHVLLLLTCAGIEPLELQAKVQPVVSKCRILCRAIDAVTTQKFASSFIHRSDRPIDITPKQLKILRYMANEDYSIKELAAVLCISPITAHQHVSAARKALNAATNIRAIIKAIKAGLIKIY